jgi:hypothetical protein
VETNTETENSLPNSAFICFLLPILKNKEQFRQNPAIGSTVMSWYRRFFKLSQLIFQVLILGSVVVAVFSAGLLFLEV